MGKVAETLHEVNIEVPAEAGRAEVDAIELADRARSMVVTTDQEFETAAEFLKVVKAMASKVKAIFDPVVARAHEAHKAATAARAQVLSPITEAEGVVKRSMSAFVDRRERERAEAERVAREAARKAAEEERLARALELEQSGRAAEAEVELARPVAPQAVAVPIQAPPRVAGVSTKKIWQFEIVDASAIKREFLVPNETAIRSAVQSLNEGAVAVVGGIRVWQETVIAGRR